MSLLKAVSMFSGAGGMDLGFIQAGFDIIWANDFFKDAVGSYRKNINENIVYGDITQIPSSDIPDDAEKLIKKNISHLKMSQTSSGAENMT